MRAESQFRLMTSKLKNVLNTNDITLPRYPIFEIIPDNHHVIRELCAVCIGCDTCPSGIKGVGPSCVNALMNKIYGESRDDVDLEDARRLVVNWMKSKLQPIDG